MQKGWNVFVVSNASDKRYYLGVSSRMIGLFAIALPLLILASLLLSINSVRELKSDNVQLQKFLIEKTNKHKKEISKRDTELANLNEEFAELRTLETQLREVAASSSDDADSNEKEKGGQGGRSGSINVLSSIDTSSSKGPRLEVTEYSADELLHEISVTRDNFNELIEIFREEQSRLASTPSINPVDCPDAWISSSFGYRKDPINGNRKFHEGLDIVAWRGTPIVAPADGIITFSGSRSGLGRAIEIDHGHGYKTTYGHTDKLLVKKGDKVKRGDKIALLGSTGRSTGPHLHYEITLNGKLINPWRYVVKKK